MNKNAKIVIGIIVAAVAIGLLSRVNQQAVPTLNGNANVNAAEGARMKSVTLDEPLKIGAVVPLTGDGAAYGVPIQRAALMALREINDAGGIGGQPVEVIWEDGKCAADESTAAAQKLISIDRVKIIFGGVCSSETLAIAPLAEQASVLVVSPSATSPDITDAGEFIFRTAPSDAFAGEVAARYVYGKLGKRNAAVLSENTDYAQALRQVFTDRFQALGGTIALDETFNTGATDFTIQIIKVKAAKPDVIYLVPQTAAPGVQLVKQLEAQAVDIQLLTAEVLIGRDIVGENGELMEGMIGVETYFNKDGPRAKALLSAYEQEYKKEAPYPFFMANMHGQFFLIKDGIEKVGLDTAALRDWLTSLKDWEGTMGKLTFDKNGDPVLAAYSILQITGGQLKDVEIFSTAE